MHCSLYLRWLAKRDKDLRSPDFDFVYSEDWGGLYMFPENGYFEFGNKEYDLKKGLILISHDMCDTVEDEASIIAHEWRHHWQWCNGHREATKFKWDRTCMDNYWENMRKFVTDPRENDAIRFQLKMAKRHRDELLKEMCEGLI